MINLTLNSFGANKTIDVLSLDNTLVSTFNNSQTVQLNYSNYILSVGVNTNSFVFENLISGATKINNEGYIPIIVFAMLCALIWGTLVYVGRRK